MLYGLSLQGLFATTRHMGKGFCRNAVRVRQGLNGVKVFAVTAPSGNKQRGHVP